MRIHLAILAAALCASAAPAQPVRSDPPPPARPLLDEQPPSPAPAVGTGTEELGERPGLLREGALLSRASGELRRLPSGRWAFVFNPDVSGWRLPPMIVMPCMTLGAMQRIVEARREAVRFAVSGQVFVYEGSNYLLPTQHWTLSDVPEAPREPSPGVVAPAAASPDVDDLMRALDEATPARRTATAPQRAEGPAAGLLREGAALSLRTGRVVRTASGSLEFVLDSGPRDPASPAEPPLALLPSQNLEAMERLVRAHGSGLTFTMSGRVFVYEGRNYLLPSIFQVAANPGSNLAPAR